jgi:hypothetical protein
VIGQESRRGFEALKIVTEISAFAVESPVNSNNGCGIRSISDTGRCTGIDTMG